MPIRPVVDAERRVFLCRNRHVHALRGENYPTPRGQTGEEAASKPTAQDVDPDRGAKSKQHRARPQRVHLLERRCTCHQGGQHEVEHAFPNAGILLLCCCKSFAIEDTAKITKNFLQSGTAVVDRARGLRIRSEGSAHPPLPIFGMLMCSHVSERNGCG